MSDTNPYATPESSIEDVDPAERSRPARLASRGARLGASLIDAALTLLVVSPPAYALGLYAPEALESPSIGQSLLGALLGIGVFLLLNGMLLANHGQTVGKRLLKMRIVSVRDHQLLPFSTVIGLRYLPIWVVSQIPLLTVLTLVDVLFIFRSDKRCLHDLIAGTKVIEDHS